MSTGAKSKSLKMNFTSGPMFFKIFAFVVPIILTGILQSSYHIADDIVVGQLSGDDFAIAAIGSTTSITNFIINFLLGLCAGTSFVVAKAYGAGDEKMISDAVHTSVSFSALGGIALMIFTLLVSEPALTLMGTKTELMAKALIYMRIICCGIPANVVYSFAAAVLRSVGDSRSPLVIISLSGLLNVILNIVFVLSFDMSVEAVGLATIISQYASAVAVLAILAHRRDEPYALRLRELRIHGKTMKRILQIGIPSSIQSSMFSITGVLFSSSANQFSAIDISAKTIVDKTASIINTSVGSYSTASMTATAQNLGAKKLDRVKTAVACCALQVTIIGILMAGIMLCFDTQIIGMFISQDNASYGEIVARAESILKVMISFYFVGGIMNSFSGSIRGLGYSFVSMMISISCVCALRILWIYTVFMIEPFHSIEGLYAAYPVTWAITASADLVALIFIYKHIKKKLAREKE